ncbi:MAG: glutaredoxin family protein [Gammaproteobacteria bacterium]|nr:glutaredoxin family protein [Gammaproteobacteria bacterium]
MLDVFSRQGCHLCEVLIEELLPLVRGVLAVDVHDIDSRPEWRAAYATRIPVVEYDGRPVCQYHLDRAAIAELLDELRGASPH